MIVEHEYTAVLHSAGADYPLPVVDGSAKLDEGWSPYGTASITIATPAESVLTALDPRLSPRLTLAASSSFTPSRSLDLVVRSRQIDHNAGTTTVTAATDDCRLHDYKRVASTVDTSNLARQTSVRSIVAAVVASAAGAVLQAGTADADFTTLDARTNMVTNPSAQVDLTGAASFQLASISRQAGAWITWAAHATAYRLNGNASTTDTALIVGGDETQMRLGMSAGKTYTASGTFYVDSKLTGTLGTRSRSIVVVAKQGTGSPFVLKQSAAAANTASTATRVSVTFTLPPDTTGVSIRWYHGAQSADTCYWSDLMLMEGDGLETNLVNPVGFFDGDTPDTPLYNYTWQGSVGVSASSRTPVFSRTPDALMWEPGESAFDFITPILTQSGLRLFCDEARVWRLVDATYEVTGIATIQVTDNLYRARDTIDRDASADDGTPLWFDAVVIEYNWNDTENKPQTAYDVAAEPGYTQPARLQFERPYPGPGAATYILGRVTGRGRSLDLSARMDFAVTPGQAFTATVPFTDTQTGRVASVRWDFGADDMTVGTRGLIDTPADSWKLTPDTLTWSSVPGTTTWNTYHN